MNGDGVDNNNAEKKILIPPGYNFFQRSGRRNDGGDSNNSAATNSKTSGYVPSGMSRAEYAAIRKMEREREQKMSYGAWGPRFKRTDRPDGDWMVMPNLWTLGQIGGNNNGKQSNGVGTDAGNGTSSDNTGLRRRIQSLARRHGPAFILGYVLVDCLYSALAMWKFQQIRDIVMLRNAYGPAYAVYRLFRSVLFALLRITPPQTQHLMAAGQILKPAVTKLAETTMAPAIVAYIQIHALKIVLALSQVRLWNGLMERANRRWLCSKSRFAITVASAATVGLAMFGILLLR